MGKAFKRFRLRNKLRAQKQAQPEVAPAPVVEEAPAPVVEEAPEPVVTEAPAQADEEVAEEQKAPAPKPKRRRRKKTTKPADK